MAGWAVEGSEGARGGTGRGRCSRGDAGGGWKDGGCGVGGGYSAGEDRAGEGGVGYEGGGCGETGYAERRDRGEAGYAEGRDRGHVHNGSRGEVCGEKF